MSKDKKKSQSQHVSSSRALDDEQRIKVLSPGRLVFQRFIRNKLAIVGVIFVLGMFLFSYLGGVIMPYREDQVFMNYQDMNKDYAGVTINTSLRYEIDEGQSFSSIAQSQFVLAVNKGNNSFTAQGVSYSVFKLAEDLYKIGTLTPVAMKMGNFAPTYEPDFTPSQSFADDFSDAVTGGEAFFTSDSQEYYIVQEGKSYTANKMQTIAFASLDLMHTSVQNQNLSFEFKLNGLEASAKGESSFEADGIEYRLEYLDDESEVFVASTGEEYAYISRYIVNAIDPDVFPSRDFKQAVAEAIDDELSSFTFEGEDGKVNEYTIIRLNNQWTIKWVESTLLINTYESPSSEHLLGTDGAGMDVLVRLMYGGRVSLMIGFIVVIIELFIGVIIGGIAGYFGKWVDNILMRVVDIFNSIPQIPVIIIIGAVMNQLRVDPQLRMIYLMIILGLFGWPSVARLVRGQILSLREQEFMTAAEATGLPVSRRIFRHLVPNVIPQIIVYSTMELGNVILTEATLSFLGIGVKFPFASWGNIINAVSNVYVMTNYTFVWIPAGLCILVTVLGFNFIGDGLRDAFDPKMKR